MADQHIRRSGADYAEAFAALLPTGTAWPRDPATVLMMLLRGQAEVWGSNVDSRSADLLETETDPRATIEMLSDWETAFGLPDPCVQEPLTIEERHIDLVQRMTSEGGQSRAFFYALAASLGYVIRIEEYSPFMAGYSRCGDTRTTGAAGETYRWQVGPPEIRFYWKVHVWGERISWFRTSSGQCGVDPLVRFSLASDLECLFNRYKPAQTQIIWDYANVTPIYDVYTPFRCSVNHCGTDPLLLITQEGGAPYPPETLPLY